MLEAKHSAESLGAVRFQKTSDDRVLHATDPSGQGGNKDLPGLENGGHASIVARLG